MIEKDTPIYPGMVVLHVDGLHYRIDDMRDTTNGYEKALPLGNKVVNYTQLEDGHFPAGKPWAKDEAEFRQYFTPVPPTV